MLPPTKMMKKPSPNRPKTIDGTPARLLTAMRTSLASRERGDAYSFKKIAVAMPTGTPASVISKVMKTVP